MKARIAAILLVLGVLSLLAQGYYWADAEKRLLQAQSLAQRASLIEGLKQNWRSFLLEKARTGELPKTYNLAWNRQGTRLIEEFFPKDESRADWRPYREAKEKGLKSLQKEILSGFFKKKNSWQRVLALKEWKEITGETPDLDTKYEETLFYPEAKKAYKRIFEQFSKDKSFLKAGREWELDGVFYAVRESGNLEAFVPSQEYVRKNYLDNFLKRNGVSEATLGDSPWDLQPNLSLSAPSSWTYWGLVGTALSISLFLLGALFYFLHLREQKELLVKRVTFLNQVVHELKTPLAGLKLHVQLIEKGIGGEKNYQALSESFGRLDVLFDDIVLMNRPSKEAELKAMSAEELNDLLKRLKDEFSQVEVESWFQNDSVIEPSRLRVILRNLVKNGIRYGERVRLSVEESEQRVTIFVKDRGEGVSWRDRERIFSEFYRAEKAKNKSADGLGLGLFIVRKISTEMGATVELKNPGESGACFCLSWPQKGESHG